MGGITHRSRKGISGAEVDRPRQEGDLSESPCHQGLGPVSSVETVDRGIRSCIAVSLGMRVDYCLLLLIVVDYC